MLWDLLSRVPHPDDSTPAPLNDVCFCLGPDASDEHHFIAARGLLHHAFNDQAPEIGWQLMLQVSQAEQDLPVLRLIIPVDNDRIL